MRGGMGLKEPCSMLVLQPQSGTELLLSPCKLAHGDCVLGEEQPEWFILCGEVRCFWKHTGKQQHHHLLSWSQLYSSTGNTVSSGVYLGQPSPSVFLLFFIHGHIIK